MALGISGFGAPHTAAAPQIFQALALSGRPPQPPAPGNTRAFPANLTLAAQPVFDALVRIGAGGLVTFEVQGPLPSGIPSLTSIPQEPVSSKNAQRQQTFAGTSLTFVAASPAHAVTSIARTVTNLTVASVYPSAIFSFHA